MISGKTRLGVLFGNPVAHSRSPAMFNAAFSAAKVDGAYVAWRLERTELKAALRTLRAIGAFGANVTVPHKEAVLSGLDRLTPLATALQCVNCITSKDGELIGDNTDVYGFLHSLRSNVPKLAALKHRPALVLGAGGAARAVVAALAELGFDEIALFNRSEGRRRTFERFARKRFSGVTTHPWSSLAAALPDAGLLVHATSAEVRGESLQLAFSALRKDAVFCDLSYGDTPLIRQAERRGLQAFDGQDMLLFQAARAFTLWTGKSAPVAAMRKALG